MQQVLVEDAYDASSTPESNTPVNRSTVANNAADEEQFVEDFDVDEEENVVDKLTEQERIELTKQLIRQTPEYTVAWELELWKRNEKKQFLQQLQHYKQEYVKKLEAQAAIRENENKQFILQQQKKLENLEDKLNKDLKLVEDHKKKLADVERELRRRKEELEHDYERKVKDMQHEISLQREQCAHKISLYDQEIQAMKQKEDHWKDQFMDLKRKFDDMIRNQQDDIESKTHVLRQELEHCKKQKKNYKFHWKQQQQVIGDLKQEKQQLLNELVRLRQNLAQAQMQQQIIIQKKKKPSSPKKKSPKPSTPPTQQQQRSPVKPPPTPEQHFHDHEHYHIVGSSVEVNKEVTRLLGEKQKLLDTGMYDESSGLIKQITDKIHQLVQDNKKK